jgi:hypothetical protein
MNQENPLLASWANEVPLAVLILAITYVFLWIFDRPSKETEEDRCCCCECKKKKKLMRIWPPSQ